MKRSMVSIFLLISILITSIPIQASASKNTITFEDFDRCEDWIYDDDSILAYVGTETTITLPTELNGTKIDKVYNRGDYGDYGDYFSLGTIKNLTVPKEYKELIAIDGPNLQTVTFARNYDEGTIDILDGCFWGCTKLKKVILPNLIKGDYLSDSCFYNCKKLTTVVMPDYLRAIGSGAFEKCTSLKSIVIPEGTEKVGDQAFAYCGFDYIKLPSSLNKLQSFVFGSDYNSENRICIDVQKGSWAENEVYEQIAEFEDWNIDVLYKIVDTENPLDGDINGDYDIDINDVTYMQLKLAKYDDINMENNIQTALKNAGVSWEADLDFNSDGVFNVRDCTAIQLALLKGEIVNDTVAKVINGKVYWER